MNKLIGFIVLVISVSSLYSLPRKNLKWTPPTSVASTSPTPCYFDCSDEPDGDYPDPTSNCTAHYYVCANGECFNFHCAGELIYNPAKDDCIYPFDDPNCAAYESTTPGPSQGTGPTAAPCTFDCSDEPDGDYQDPANNCTGHYYVCANGLCFNYYCHTPLVFDPANDECVNQADWPGCHH